MKMAEYKRIRKQVDTLRGMFFDGRTKPYRVETKVWKNMLINEDDRITLGGRVRKFAAKSIGAGVYEVWLEERQ